MEGVLYIIPADPTAIRERCEITVPPTVEELRKIVGGYIGIVHGFTSIDTSTVGGAVISQRSRIAFGSAGMMYSNPFIACPRARACGARRKKERMREISA